MSSLLRRAASGVGDAADWVGDQATDLYTDATAWNFEGRDAMNARGGTPTLDELTGEDSPWREMSDKETIYHDNNDGYAERKFIRDDPDSFLGLGGYEYVHDGRTDAPMEPGALQATYNYVNPAEGGMGDLSPGGIARNLGHVAFDVIPYILGGTVRGDEGNNIIERAVGPANYEKLSSGVNSAVDWVGDTASGIGNGISDGVGWLGDQASNLGSGIADGWDTATSWAGGVADSAGSAISGAASWAGDAASSAGGAIADGAGAAMDWAGGAASSAGGAIASLFGW